MAVGPRPRDRNIMKLIREHKSRVLMEIGICRCRNSVRMIKAAAETWPEDQIVYYGFDVFSEGGNKQLWRRENSACPWGYEHVKRYLAATNARVQLYQGFTQDTLPKFTKSQHQPIDFIWLDGGHTYETCLNDWLNVEKLIQPHTVILFDDYVKHIPEDDQWGVSRVIDQIDRSKYSVKHIEPYDPYVINIRGPQRREICAVKVTLK